MKPAKLEYVQATAEHLRALAENIREEDAAECRALLGVDALEALTGSARASDATYALLSQGKVLVIFGVAQWPNVAPGAMGNAWFLTSKHVEQHKREFLKASPVAVRVLLCHYPVLVGMMDARYERALLWARWLGFEFLEKRPYGVERREFFPVIARSDTWDR